MDQQATYFLHLLTKFSWLGNWLFFLISFIECIPLLGSIFPGGTIIFIAGILAAHGYFNVIDLFIFSTLGALAGDYLSHLLGRSGGKYIREKNIIKESNITRSENFFKKYGAPSIFWTRFTGSTWATMPFISGTMRVKRRVFLLWNTLGVICWAATRVFFGFFSGNIIAVVIRKWSNRLGIIVSIILVIAFLYWLIKKHHKNIWRWYLELSEKFCAKLFSYAWFKELLISYPVIGEFIKTKISQEKILGGFIGMIILIILYLLVLILDLV
ncbi:MAG: DedA family protein [Patescibacteria group bacterium]